jgi:DNA polymerase
MNRQRQHYLKAMGIQFWQRRHTPFPPGDSPLAIAHGPPASAEDCPEISLSSPSGHDSGISTGSTPLSLDDDSPPPAQSTAVSGAMAVDAADDAASPTVPSTPTRVIRIAAMNWEDLATEVRGCTACGLHAGRKQAVFGVGNRQAHCMIVGEAPGADEDRLGEPFVGRSGKLLDLMLQALSLDRESAFIANVIKCRPPQNRDPTSDEAACCRPFLERQVALVKPRIILAVGRVAAQNLLNTQQPVGKLRNRVHHFGTPAIPLVVTYHPAYLLRSPREKRKAWQDLQLARRALLDSAPETGRVD